MSQKKRVYYRSVVGSALAAGCYRWQLSGSSRSFTGHVIRASFAFPVLAGNFARQQAQRVGVSVAVRRAGHLWVASVPVTTTKNGGC